MASIAAPSPIARWWGAHDAPSRRRMRAIATAAALALVVLGLAQPMMRSADAKRNALARDAVALAQARARVADIAALARTSPAAGDPKRDLDRVLAESGLQPAVAQLEWKGDRARVAFDSVPFDALVHMLEAAQRNAHLRVVDARLLARVEPGTVRAELTLGR